MSVPRVRPKKLSATKAPIGFGRRPTLEGGSKSEKHAGRRSRLVRQATVQFGAAKLHASKTPSMSRRDFRAAMAEEAAASSAAPSAGGSFASMPSLSEEGEEDEEDGSEDVIIEVEEMVRAMLTDFLEAGYLQGHPTWTSCPDGKYMNVSFTCHGDLATLVVLKLEYIGIGSDVGAVNATPVQVGRSAVHARKLAEKRREELRLREERKEIKRQRSSGAEYQSSGHRHIVDKLTGAMEDVRRSARQHWGRFFVPEHDTKFLKIASVFRVEELAEQIAGMALFTFDYIMFVVIASIIAAVGLATDNAVVVVAAMLVSPIMGPIMAFTFGFATKDRGMVVSGVLVELLSLSMCIVAGFVYGVLALPTLKEGDWPTEQMFSRGAADGLVYGIIVAIPSGMGVALSLLDQNVGGLVGVAISASLLPPAVGAGMYWAFSALGDYMCDFPVDRRQMAHEGAVSFALTVVNIVCVTLAALFMFMLKRVVPSTQNESFWKRDLRHAQKHSLGDDEPCGDLPSVKKLLHQSGTQSNLHYDAVGPSVPGCMPTVEENKC